VIDTDEGIQQSVLRDNPYILRQLIDEKIAEMERRGEFFLQPLFSAIFSRGSTSPLRNSAIPVGGLLPT